MRAYKWNRLYLLTIIFIISIVASTNYIVDPGNIYLKKSSATYSDTYISKLLSSPYGLISTGWNERSVKSSLAKYANNYDCIILGSSHIMQVSHIRNTANIQSVCSNSINLGVSGGSIEDIAVFSNIVLEHATSDKEKTIFIGIDPWTLKFGMDERYQALKHDFDAFNQRLKNTKDIESTNYDVSLIKNLVNIQYFITSLKELHNYSNKNTLEIKEPVVKDPKTFYTNGYTQSVFLPDGSLIYTSQFIAEQKLKIKNLPIGGGDYKISDESYDPNAVEYLKKIVRLYQDHAMDVSFILTPYHPNVFKRHSKTTQHIEKTEAIVRGVAKELDIHLYGSFNPHNVGCQENEFFDFMHATQSCLDKIQLQEIH